MAHRVRIVGARPRYIHQRGVIMLVRFTCRDIAEKHDEIKVCVAAQKRVGGYVELGLW